MFVGMEKVKGCTRIGEISVCGLGWLGSIWPGCRLILTSPPPPHNRRGEKYIQPAIVNGIRTHIVHIILYCWQELGDSARCVFTFHLLCQPQSFWGQADPPSDTVRQI
jgi:hypothetical protein